MRADELVGRFKTFLQALREHQKLWSESTGSWMADGIVRNHETVFDQQRELTRMLAVLNPYINQFALGRILGGYGQTWDMFASATTDDHPIRKSRSLQEAIQQIDGVIARLELEPANRDIPERPGPQRQESAATSNETLRDSLVPLQDRRGLEAAFKVHANSTDPACLVLFDIDHFKRVNDDHGGHATGDEALLDIAAVAAACTRGKGEAFRVGGDEFALLLPNHTLEEGLAVAERFRRQVNSVPRTSRQLSLSVSVGVAVWPEHGNDLDELRRAADDALYDAKRRNRNIVRYYKEPEPAPSTAAQEPTRKVPQPGGLSDAERQRIREQYFRNRMARCPRDKAILDVQDTTAMGQERPSIYVTCPLCGLAIELE